MPFARREPPKPVVCLPSPEKVVSSEPSGCSGRGRSRRRLVPTARPTATILPSPDRHARRALVAPPRSVVACRRPRNCIERAVRRCSGRGRSRRGGRQRSRRRRSCRRLDRHLGRRPLDAAEVGVRLPSPEKLVSRVPLGCSGRGRSRTPRRRRLPTTTILPSAWIATPFASSTPPKSVVCLPSPEKLVSSVPSGCSGRGRSRGRRRPVQPTATILPSAWTATAVRPVGRRRSRSSACRRPRSSCRASRSGCSGRARSRCAMPHRGRPRRSCRRPGAPPPCASSEPREVGRLLAVAGEVRCRASRSGCSGRARSRSRAARRPTATILPSLERHRVRGRQSRPKSVVCLPSPEKLVSSEPFGL